MRVERALLEELPEKKFNIGYQGEQNHTQVIISCPIMFRDYPDAVASMVVKPPQGDLYPVSLTRDGNDLTWDVSDADVAIPGEGILQLTFTDGESDTAEIIKTVYGSYSVNASLVANGEAPDPVQSWLDEAGAALATFENEIGDIRKITTATDADEGKALSPKTVTNGKVTEWEYIDLADPEVVTQAVDDWLDDHPEATTTVQDGAITEAKLNSTLKDDLAWQTDVDGLMSAIEQKANVDGYYEDLTAGNAEQLVGTVGVADSVPYNFRTTGGSADVGDRLKESAIVGGTVAWNQMVINGNFADTTGWSSYGITLSASNNVGKLTITDEGSHSIYQSKVGIVGHKYFASFDIKGSRGNAYLRFGTNSPIAIQELSDGSIWVAKQTITTFNTAPNSNYLYFALVSVSADDEIYVKNLNVIDLTAMFGSTIADYIYTLETATPGAGVAWFRKLFPKAYYAYNAGSLESVSTSKHREVEFNQWDEEWEVGTINTTTGATEANATRIRSKNFIPVISNANYYVQGANAGQTLGRACFYDANKMFISAMGNFPSGATEEGKVFTTPNNACFMKFSPPAGYGTTYNHDICINLHWDGERDGEYEAYKVREYDLPNVVLRGIPKLDASNNLYYDGDVLTPDGTVTRKYGIVDLGTLTWTSENDAVTGLFRSDYMNNPEFFAIAKFGENNLCSKYKSIEPKSYNLFNNDEIGFSNSADFPMIRIKDENCSTMTGAQFKALLSGVYLIYELDTPTTESADPWQETQIVNDFGTEEYVDRLATAAVSPRDVEIPVGHISTYQSNLRAKLEMSPDSPDGDGLYLVKQTSGQNEYVAYVPELPTNPNDNGTYTLKVTVSGSTKTLAWVADT